MSPYVMPDTKATTEASAWPREYITLSLPLSPFHVANLSAPRIMTEREWGIMMSVLEVMRPCLVEESRL